MMNKMMGQNKGQAPISVSEELNKYRSLYSKEREKLNKGADEVVAEDKPVIKWADDLSMPEPEGPQVTFSEELQVPEEVLHSTDSRFSGNKEQDDAAIQQYLLSDPAFQEHGEQMQDMIEELASQVRSGDISQQEAQQLFLEMMNSHFAPYFQ